MIVGIIYENTGMIRHAMWYLIFVLCAGWYLIVNTDEFKGSDDCRRKEILVRMQADRKKFGVSKAGAPPSAKKMAGLKSSKMYTGQSGYSSAGSTKSSGGQSSVERSKFSMYNKNKVAPSQSKNGFGGATVVEGQDEGGGINNQTVIEDTGDGGFNNQTVIEDTGAGGFGNETVIEDTGGGGFGNETVIEDNGDNGGS